MARQPKIEWNVYCRVGAIDKFLGSTWAPSEKKAVANIWFRLQGRKPMTGNLFARAKREELFQPKELLKPGEQLRFA